MNTSDKKFLKDYFVITIVVIFVIYVFTHLVGYIISFSNDYMNINGTQPINLLVSRAQYYNINRGDILIYDHSFLNKSAKVGRLIGLPNEKLDIKNIKGVGVIFINNNELKEPYTNAIPYENFNCEKQKCLDIVLPNDSYLLLTDSRKKPVDINSCIINKKRISDKAFFLIPKNSFKIEKINSIEY